MVARVAILTELRGATVLNRGLGQFQTAFTGISKQAQAANTNIKKVTTEGDRLTTLIRGRLTGAFAGLGAVLGVREVVRLADSWQLARNRLTALLSSQREATSVQAQLLRISNETRVGFEGTADAFARLALGARELGVSNEELLQVTKTLNQAIIVSGASSAEANAAMIQLAQGIASGTLRGDELRSVLEQLPIVARLIAREMGVTIGELRELGSQGAITADVVLSAFRSGAKEIDDAFSRTRLTVGQAFTVLGNNLQGFIGRVDQATEASGFFANIIAGLGEGIGNLGSIVFPTLNEEIERTEELARRLEDEDRLSSVFESAAARAELLREDLEDMRAELDLEAESIAEADRRLRQLESSRRREADARRTQSVEGQKVIEELQFELQQMRLSNEERAVAIALREADKNVTEEERVQIEALTREIVRQKQAEEELQEALKREADLRKDQMRVRQEQLELEIRIGEKTLEDKLALLRAELTATNLTARERLRIEAEIATTLSQIAEREIALIEKATERELEELQSRLGATRAFAEEKLRILSATEDRLRKLSDEVQEQGRLAGEANKKVREEIEETEAESTRARRTIANDLGSIGRIGTAIAGTLQSTFSSLFSSMVRGTVNFGQAFTQIFTGIIDAVLAEFARLAASQVFQLLFGDPGGRSEGRAIGSSIVAGGGLFGTGGIGATAGGGGGVLSAGLGAGGLALGGALGPLFGLSALAVSSALAGRPQQAALGILGAGIGGLIASFFGAGPLGLLAGGLAGFLGGGFLQTGGSRVVTSPTLFAAGEVRPERVTVTPLAEGIGGPAGSAFIFQGPVVFDQDVTLPLFQRFIERANRGSARRIVG